MAVDTRHTRILEALQRRGGYASVEELATALAVTPQTVRRDVADMAERGLLRRHHGGASLPSTIANTDYAHRHVEHAREKAEIARAAAVLVPDGSSVFLALGTTAEATAAALAATHRDLVVVTNSVAAAHILGAAPGMRVNLLGGRWQARNSGLAGVTTVEMVGRWHCDTCVLGIGGITQDGWLLDYHEDEVAVVRAMQANATRLIVVADRAKFGRVAPHRVAQVKRGDTLVTDQVPSPAHVASLKRLGVGVLQTDEVHLSGDGSGDC
ncbi:DeoR/GlpR family DNA-binding transcription regulator [Roseomonas elaeocarpi]|uniref:DeoR/GlpR family DNA-binding transcription regulator n=1 Tax=Roseomonas elaeocarpi TaxID=907779 RepID=A0ABV6JPK0_9PROT